MLYLLAQATSAELKDAAKKGVEAGLENASWLRPSEFLMGTLCVALFGIAMWAVFRSNGRVDRIAEKFTDAIGRLFEETSKNERIARDSCHASMEKVAASNRQGTDSLRDAVSGLQAVVTNLTHTADDFKQIAHDTRGILQQKRIEDEISRAQRPQQHEVHVMPPTLPTPESP